MPIDRREFVLALGSAAALTAVAGRGWGAPVAATAPAGASVVVDAGELREFAIDGVYAAHREEGLFVIRRGDRVFALSSVCTHRGCKVRPQEDGSFLCKCHNSTFDRDGKVTRGPASKDLPRLAVAVDAAGRLQVDVSQKFEAGHFSPRRP